MYQSLNEGEVVDKRIAKVGVGAYLTASATTAVTTSYTTLLGTFDNVEISGFEIDVPTSKLKYLPSDGVTRTFNLIYSGVVKCPSNNDVVTVGIEHTNGSAAIVAGTETAITCRIGGSSYPFAKVFPMTLESGDLIEIQVKGDASFTLTMDEFSTTLTKMY